VSDKIKRRVIYAYFEEKDKKVLWEIDHKNPKSKGGSDKPQNLQPLYWEENLKKVTNIPIGKKTVS